MADFEKAAREKFRYITQRGPLSVEDLFDLPLLSKSANGLDLDSIAIQLTKESKDYEVSFVKKKSTKGQVIEDKLDIVKHIISVKIKERDELLAAVENKEKREVVLQTIVDLEKEDLKGKSIEDLKKMAEELKTPA